MRGRSAGLLALLFGFSPAAVVRRARKVGKWALVALLVTVALVQYAWARAPWAVVLVAVVLTALAGLWLWMRVVPAPVRSSGTRGSLDRDAVYYRDGGRCYLCGKPAGARTWHLEHTIPICEGGPDEYWNVGVACAECNLRKGAADPRRDWRWKYALDAIPGREERSYLIREYLQRAAV